MASPSGLRDSHEALNHLSPTLLTDPAGSPIVPTVIPPSTGFSTYDGRASSESRNGSQGRKSSESTKSYFDQDHVPRQNIDPHATLKDHEHPSQPVSDPQEASRPRTVRAGTAPVDAMRPGLQRQALTERPQPAARPSTLMERLTRRSTRNLHNDEALVPHTTDTNLDDSSSSSSEDEAETKRRQDKKAQAVGDRKKRKELQKQQSYSKFNVGNDQYQTRGRVSKKDGRLNISINETANSGYIAKALGQSMKHHLDIPHRHGGKWEDEQGMADGQDQDEVKTQRPSVASASHGTVPRPKLNIVIMVIGSRGDIQPFLRIGKILQDDYGHRVRIATHPTFRKFVQDDIGLEFFSVGGDPSELMAFMVKNPGLIPSMQTVKAGEIGRRRQAMAEMFEGFWRACVNATDDEKDRANFKMMGDKHPFVADAIIANPPSFAHVHIAERLGVPLHMMFTFPYSPTQAFPHPLANIKPQKSNVDANYVNFMSYPLVEMMTWQGLGDLVNKFRVKTLGLEPVSSLWAPGALFRMKVPYTYMWSRELVPKPKDWGPEIDISGFVFLDLASNFKPPKELTEFLEGGDPPVYIGFGSIVVDDPDKFTTMIFDAVKMAGVRALVSKGWGGLGDEGNTPDNIYMLENTPHDWLFPQCSAVIHHGGAGTTAIGLKCGKPTMIVPFFGDQPFWGSMVAEHKAGASKSIPYKNLDAKKLAEGIKECLQQEAKDNAAKIAESIELEGDGAANAVKSFQRSLPMAGRHNMRCSILQDHVAVWQHKHSSLRLSALAAEFLVEEKKIKWSDLQLLRHYEWNDFDGPGEPFSGGGSALLHSGTGIAKGVGMIPVRMAKHIKKRDEHDRKKKAAVARREARQQRKAAAAQHRGEVKGEIAPDGVGKKWEQQMASRPNGPSHMDTATTTGSKMSADPEDPLAKELAQDAGNGLAATGVALAEAPLDLGLAVAQGFHNAPRLYGDASVRKPKRITGFKSGLKAAGSELVFGVYDGFTGLVTQPIGAWKDGNTVPHRFAGLGKGFAYGLGGFILKDISAIITPPAFLAQGVRKEIHKRVRGPGADAWIRKAHIIRGQKDIAALSKDPHDDNSAARVQQRVDEGWRIMSEVWDTVGHENETGGPLAGKWRVSRERKRWRENGALENISTTERALETKKQGKSLDGLFQQRRKEMEIAQRPRATALDQADEYEEEDNVGRNTQPDDEILGPRDKSSKQGPRTEVKLDQTTGEEKRHKQKDSVIGEGKTRPSPSGEEPPVQDPVVETDDTDSTAVATPENGPANEHIRFGGEKTDRGQSLAGRGAFAPGQTGVTA